MRTKDLKVGSWYLYRSEFLVVHFLFHISASSHWRLWRFQHLDKQKSVSFVPWFDLWNEEVRDLIEPVDPVLNQYLSVFDVDRDRYIDHERGH